MNIASRSTTTRGVLYVHSSPSALSPHVEWAVAGVFGAPPDCDWVPQAAEPGTYRTEFSWQGAVGSAAKVASALRGWERLRFEITEEATPASEGGRYSYTPDLGIFHAPVGLHGDLMIPENRLKAIMNAAARGETPLELALETVLGRAWDEELEPFRHAGDGASVRWLHQVV